MPAFWRICNLQRAAASTELPGQVIAPVGQTVARDRLSRRHIPKIHPMTLGRRLMSTTGKTPLRDDEEASHHIHGENPDKTYLGRRYKTEIASVSPPSARGKFEEHEACFLGISLENGNFTPKKLRSMITWISRRFARCTVLVGDSIHRITLECSHSLSEPEATSAALRMGTEFLRDSREIFDAVRDSVDLTFLTCSEVQQGADYASLHKELWQNWEADPAFRASVEGFARRYHQGRAVKVDREQLDYRIRRSCEYFLEEFAIFACLQRQGLPVMVYPGSFSTLSEITRGEHSGTPRELQELIIVSLSLKGK